MNSSRLFDRPPRSISAISRFTLPKSRFTKFFTVQLPYLQEGASSESSWAWIAIKRLHVDSHLSSKWSELVFERITMLTLVICARFYTHAEAVDCMRYVSGTKLDERVIRCDLDPGYKEGRQYGRGKSGGQVRDEYRQEYDAGRGGWGHNRLREEEERQRMEAEQARREKREELYQEQDLGMGGGGGGLVPAGAEHMYEEMEADARGHAGQVQQAFSAQMSAQDPSALPTLAKKRERSYDDDDQQLYKKNEKVRAVLI